MRAHGAPGPSFATIVAAGPHSAVPHHSPTPTPLRRGDLVKLDFGALVDGYHSDMTRTVVLGPAADWQRELYALVAAAQAAGRAALRAGRRRGRRRRGRPPGRRATRGAARSSCTASATASGLQIHEAPLLGASSGRSAGAGMAVTVEPGVYLDGRGGVRIEDTLVVRDGEPSCSPASRRICWRSSRAYLEARTTARADAASARRTPRRVQPPRHRRAQESHPVATTNDLKNGLVLNLDGQLWSVTAFQHVKPGKGGAFVRTTLKNVMTGKVVDKTFNAGTKVDTATVDRRDMTFLYRDGADFVFMDGDTYDQITIPVDTVGDAAGYLLENQVAMVALHEGVPLYVELPASVELVIAHTEPGLQGDRSTGGTKPATAGDRRRDPGAAVPHHRREGQGRHARRPLPRPRLVADRLMIRARTRARKRALDILFESEARGDDPLAVLAQRRETDDAPPVSDYAAMLVEGVTAHRERIDRAARRARRGLDGGPHARRRPHAAAHRGVRAAVGRRDRRPGGDHGGGRAGPHAVHRRQPALPQRGARADLRHRRAPACGAVGRPPGLTGAGRASGGSTPHSMSWSVSSPGVLS